MKYTKCLYPDGVEPVGMVSVSQLQSFMSCPKKWAYGYVENLTPRVERPYLSVGKLCHKGMETVMKYKWEHEREQGWCRENALREGIFAIMGEWSEYMNSNCFLAEEIPAQEQIQEDAIKVFSQAFWEFDIDKYEVLTVCKKGVEMPAVELHFLVPCKGSKGLHGYIDAILRDKTTGFTWCTDYKFRKSISPDEDEEVNIQNAVYAYACKKMGIEITGTMTWQHVNTPAADPSILKNGTFSRAKIKTTWQHYAECVSNAGGDPEEYREEMEPKLADIEWFRPTYEYRNEETVKRMWTQVVEPTSMEVNRHHNQKLAVSNKYAKRVYPWNCKMCQYRQLCQAELRDYDVGAIKAAEYVVREHARKPIDKDIVDVV